MKKDEIHLNDWLRILFGEVPAEFYIELVIRAFVIYLILIISMRAMGKRMASQLSRNELAALVSLAAAIGVPMMAPDRGLLPAMAVALVVVGVERIMANIAIRYQGFEKFSQGNISLLVKDSIIDLKVLKKTRIPRQLLFAQLRCAKIVNLGEVERFFMEANGSFTLIKRKEPKAGLCVLPPTDESFISQMKLADDVLVCHTCGNTIPKPVMRDTRCAICKSETWAGAIEQQEF